MTLSDFSVVAFAAMNGARVVAYVPQIICVRRDPNGAMAVSLTTWALFVMANATTVTYTLVISRDVVMAGMFGLNVLGSLAICALIVKQRVTCSRTLPLREDATHSRPQARIVRRL
jgi:hypothetical protein